MKNQYVGDIGDYGKYGLLRFLANHGIKIGVNWYLTENDGSADGRFTGYLKQPVEKIYDPELFDVLREYAFQQNKTVKMIEDSGIIPGADFYSEILKSSNLDVHSREWNRRLWFNNSKLLLQDVELVFADPDNGITYRKTARTKGSEKYILPEEIVEYYNSGRNVVYYCHKGRRKKDEWDLSKTKIREYIRDAQILAVTCHRGTQRSYIFVLHPDCFQKYYHILESFLDSDWSGMFTWEDVSGNAAAPSEQTRRTADISLELLEIDFSICKVEDYSEIDLQQPFVFTGSTDQEKSLVCPTEIVPKNTIAREDGWKAVRIRGELDFSLIGVLAGITQVLAERRIGIFAISTFSTDYVLTKEVEYEKAIHALKEAGYSIIQGYS